MLPRFADPDPLPTAPEPIVEPYDEGDVPLEEDDEDSMVAGEVVRTGTNVPALSQMRVLVIHGNGVSLWKDG